MMTIEISGKGNASFRVVENDFGTDPLAIEMWSGGRCVVRCGMTAPRALELAQALTVMAGAVAK